MLLTGGFDKAGSPTLRIGIAGDGPAREFAATIDTGFTGFVSLPLVEMIPLRLKTETAATVTLGDGSEVEDLAAQGSVTLADKTEQGVILLSETSTDVLVGMDFLRRFNLALIVTPTVVLVYDEAETLLSIMRMIRNAPLGQPNTAPTST